MSIIRKVLVTTGDRDGIGFEVTAKALARVGPSRGIQFFVYQDPRQKDLQTQRLSRLIERSFTVEKYLSLDQALKAQAPGHKILSLIQSTKSPALWVEESARACLQGKAQAMATAPLSKPLIQKAGLKDLGHTDILKRICRAKNAYMSFVGDQFNVVLATGHLPIADVPQALSVAAIEKAIRSAAQIKCFLPPHKARLPLAILGLNPHAGDQGLIGKFENSQLIPLLKRLRKSGLLLDGPLVPDVAFKKDNWSKYSAYVCLYHDQGLIPFKMIHGLDHGVHITLGLPIWRTSVDHGTAQDIFAKNKANPQSMVEALKWATQLARRTDV